MKPKSFLFLLFTMSLFATQKICAQTSFEGMLEFQRKEGAETRNYRYLVKGKKIRIIIYDPAKKNRVWDEDLKRYKISDSSAIILNLDSGTIIGLSLDYRLWSRSAGKTSPITPEASNFSLVNEEEEERLKILGYNIRKKVVALTSEKTQVVYWTASGKFNFFKPMMSLYRNKEFFPAYLRTIDMPDGSLPLEVIKKQADGTVSSKMTLIKSEEKVIADEWFEIPGGYKEFTK